MNALIYAANYDNGFFDNRFIIKTIHYICKNYYVFQLEELKLCLCFSTRRTKIAQELTFTIVDHSVLRKLERPTTRYHLCPLQVVSIKVFT